MPWESQFRGTPFWKKIFRDYDEGKIVKIREYCLMKGICHQVYYNRIKRYLLNKNEASKIKIRRGAIERKDEIKRYLFKRKYEEYTEPRLLANKLHKELLQEGFHISKSSVRRMLSEIKKF